MLTEDWIRRRWLEACDSTAITLGAFKTIARAIEAEVAAKAGKSPVARVREHGDFQATVDLLLNPLPDGTELFDAPVACPKCDEWQASEHKLSDAYLRIRQKLNAFDTPHGPTADQVYEHTEAALDALQAKVSILDGLSQDAIDGGWTYRGMNAYAVGLEAKVAELEAKLPEIATNIEVGRAENAAQTTLIEQSEAAIELLLERIEVPDANCSCHLSPPCNDCIEFGGIREALQDGRSALEAVADHKKVGAA